MGQNKVMQGTVVFGMAGNRCCIFDGQRLSCRTPCRSWASTRRVRALFHQHLLAMPFARLYVSGTNLDVAQGSAMQIAIVPPKCKHVACSIRALPFSCSAQHVPALPC